MIKKHHTHITLLILFFTGLFVLWWADVSDVPTSEQRRERSNRILPDLLNTPLDEVHRVEVDNPRGRFVFQRRGEGSWQMLRPIDAAADAGPVTTLVRNLKELRKSPDAGTIQTGSETSGLDPPDTTVRLFGSEPEKLLAMLEVGKEIRLDTGKKGAIDAGSRRHVQPIGRDGKKEGIEVVDGRFLGMVDFDAFAWREKTLFNTPTFAVAELSVTGPGRDLTVERVEGHWKIRRPIRALADDDKVEGVLAALTSLRVAEGTKGFAADDVKDFAPYGLDNPTTTVTLKTSATKGKPMVLDVGKAVPGLTNLYYARVGDQDDVVMIDGKELRDFGVDPRDLRGRRVSDLDPRRATFIEINAHGRDFRLGRSSAGWFFIDAQGEKADTATVQNLLLRLGDLQAMELLDADKVANAQLDPPAMILKVWQPTTRERTASDPPSKPEGEPLVSLRIGRHDSLRKALYARLEGDATIMALPEAFLDVLPKNAFAFQDRMILTLNPASITRLTVRRDARTYELEAPGASGDPNDWKMLTPVESPADSEAITRLTSLISNLTAENLLADKPGDGKEYGLDNPTASVGWKLDPQTVAKGQSREGVLKIGARVPRSEEWYARIEGKPIVFTVSPAVVQILRAEFHQRKVLAFAPDQVARLVLRWPIRTLTLVPKASRGGPPAWRPEHGQDAASFDLSKVAALVGSLSNLRTEEFAQYLGIFSPSLGLDRPNLTIEIHLTGSLGTKVLRIGDRSPEGPLYATTENGSAGAVFTLAGPAWAELARPSRQATPELPANPFMPE